MVLNIRVIDLTRGNFEGMEVSLVCAGARFFEEA